MSFQFLQGAKLFLATSIACACLSTFMEMLRPKIVEFTVDGILSNSSFTLPVFLQHWLDAMGGADYLRANLWLAALAVIVCSLLSAVFRGLFRTLSSQGGERFVKTMRDSLYEHIQCLSTAWHSTHQTGDIIQRCTTDVEEVKLFLADLLPNFVSMLITISLSLFFLLQISLQLGFVVLAGVPILVGFSFWFHQKISTTFRDCDENEGVLSTIAQENLTGVRVVRAFGRERVEQKKFADQNEIVTDKWIHLGKYLCTYWFCGDMLTGCMMLVILVWGCALCVDNALTVGGLLAVISYLAMLIRPVRNMGRVLSEMSKTGVSMTRLLDIMKALPEEDVANADEPAMDGDITFEHVCFSYAGHPEVLHDISFTIPAGTTLGILGGTGSGKSTIAHLLARLYPLSTENGIICIGGRDIQSMRAQWVRKNVGFVMLEPFLFSRSIADSIAIAQNQTAIEEVRRAARAACLENTIDEFPGGFDTFVGERGVTLSGGQKQRAAIARTLIQNAPILIFDDSLSAVDAQTDAFIRENLKTYMTNATVILISHRISTLREADQILVLENGSITARGTHDALLEQSELYRKINEIQEGGDEDA